MYARSPQTTGYDAVSAMGYSLTPVYYIYSKYKGIDVYLFNFEPKVQLLLVFRVVLGLINNVCIFQGLMYISVSKGILIWSLSPMF